MQHKPNSRTGRANVRAGRISRLLFPGYGSCGRCRTVWALVRPHYTEYDSEWVDYSGEGSPPEPGGSPVVLGRGHSRGVGPLCEKCWAGLGSATARWPYYEELITDVWGLSPGDRRWQKIRRAVYFEAAAPGHTDEEQEETSS